MHSSTPRDSVQYLFFFSFSLLALCPHHYLRQASYIDDPSVTHLFSFGALHLLICWLSICTITYLRDTVFQSPAHSKSVSQLFLFSLCLLSSVSLFHSSLLIPPLLGPSLLHSSFQLNPAFKCVSHLVSVSLFIRFSFAYAHVLISSSISHIVHPDHILVPFHLPLSPLIHQSTSLSTRISFSHLSPQLVWITTYTEPLAFIIKITPWYSGSLVPPSILKPSHLYVFQLRRRFTVRLRCIALLAPSVLNLTFQLPSTGFISLLVPMS